MSTPFQFYRPSEYNSETKFQLWTTALIDQHDAWCSCCRPMAHLLSGLFPPDHKDYNLTIKQIIEREYNTPLCHFSGEEERNFGEGATGHGTEEIPTKEEDKEEEKEDLDIEGLIAAAEEAEKR